MHDGSIWHCLQPWASYDLGDWSGAVSESLLTNIIYKSNVTDNVTSLAITPVGEGGCITIDIDDNPAGAQYSIANPSSKKFLGNNQMAIANFRP